ncbi:tyrosine-type recombinase/integrase [Bradyrhizobium sp. UFLA05-153]
MGHSLATIKKPKHVHGYVDRHGRPRFYYRRKGHKLTPLPGLPWSPQFMQAYERAASGTTAEPIGARLIKAGTIKHLINVYFNSLTFAELARETQRTRRNILIKFERNYGDLHVATLKRKNIVTMFEMIASKRFLAINWLKTLRALMKFGVDNGMVKDDPTQGVKNLSGKTHGYRTWEEGDVAKFEAKHSLGTRERLALELLVCTGQRRSDIVKMGRQHVRNGAILVSQQKTGTPLAIPIHPDLQASIDAMSCKDRHLTYLTTARGKSFSPEGFTNWFRSACNAAGLPKGTSAHGLRKTAAVRLVQAGCSLPQTAAITGHKSLKELQHY